MSDPFDFESFIRGTSLPRRTVGAFAKDRRDAIQRLVDEHDALPADSGDERESSVVSSRRQEIAAQIAALRAEMESSRVNWTLRTLGPEEFKQLTSDDGMGVFDQIAMQSRAPEGCANPSLYNDLPNLTADQWKQIAGAIGAVQWGALVEDANSLILSKVAVPDFSPSASGTPSPQAPSEN